MCPGCSVVDHRVSHRIVCCSMAIRFQCASCSQPIEVDDEWASKAVACPYCRKTVTAPAESTLGDVTRMPTASPLGTGPAGGATGPLPPDPLASPDLSANHVAVAALVLVCSAVALLGVANLILAPHREEINRLIETMRPAQTFAEMMELQGEYIQEMGGLPGWMMAAFSCEIGAGMAWLASIVCAVIGVRRVRRRRLAVLSLAIAAVVPIFFCCGGIVGAGP